MAAKEILLSLSIVKIRRISERYFQRKASVSYVFVILHSVTLYNLGGDVYGIFHMALPL